jgi:hypothetical protein
MKVIVDNDTGRLVSWTWLPPEQMTGKSSVSVPVNVYRWLGAGFEHVYAFDTSTWVITNAGHTDLVAAQWTAVRTRRRDLLLATDFTQAPDAPFDPTTKTAWAVYRQALRDVTSQPNPATITWPEPVDPGIIAYVEPLRLP